jgi:hypothetical protein
MAKVIIAIHTRELEPAWWPDAAPGRTSSNAGARACYTARHFDLQA